MPCDQWLVEWEPHLDTEWRDCLRNVLQRARCCCEEGTRWPWCRRSRPRALRVRQLKQLRNGIELGSPSRDKIASLKCKQSIRLLTRPVKGEITRESVVDLDESVFENDLEVLLFSLQPEADVLFHVLMAEVGAQVSAVAIENREVEKVRLKFDKSIGEFDDLEKH